MKLTIAIGVLAVLFAFSQGTSYNQGKGDDRSASDAKPNTFPHVCIHYISTNGMLMQ